MTPAATLLAFAASGVLAVPAFTGAAFAVPAAAGPAGRVTTAHVDLELAPAAGALQPSAGTVAAAEAAVTALGLHLDSAHASYLTVSGPAGLVAADFPKTSPHLLGAVLGVPAALSSTVLGATDADDKTPVEQAHAFTVSGQAGRVSDDQITSYDSAQLATDYQATAPGGYPRTRPTLTAASPVIATLQLAGFDANSLRTYSQQVAFSADPGYDPTTMPAGAPQFTAVGVDRTPNYDSSQDSDEASSEFALDEEAILDAAPEARSRAYVATNTAAGALRAMEDVLDDVTRGVPIVAFSSSWGSCEPANSLSYISQLEGIMKRLNAAGVTLFAASGDDGLRDCAAEGRDDAQVDYPASSPQVVGVGGTEHPGAGVPDTAWSDPVRGVGTGGGVSTVFARPAYQSGVGSGDARMVPDIAADADIRTGFVSYLPDHSESAAGSVRGPVTVGGTSLSSPLSAALLVNVEAAHGFAPGTTRGLGDIHRALYTASTVAPGSIIDVTGVSANDPVTVQAAGVGYDKATGLGSPLWSALAPALYSAAPPASAAPKVTVASVTPTGAQFTFREPSGVSAYGWYVDDAHDDQGCTGNPLHAGALVQLPMGRQSIAVHSIGSDLVCSKAKTMTVTVGQDDRSGKKSRGWANDRNKAAFGGTYAQSHSRGSTLTWSRIDGRVYDVLLDRQKAAGVAQILVDGKVVRTVSVTSDKDHWALKSTVSVRVHGKHTITVKVLSGTVRVDGLLLH